MRGAGSTLALSIQGPWKIFKNIIYHHYLQCHISFCFYILVAINLVFIILTYSQFGFTINLLNEKCLHDKRFVQSTQSKLTWMIK